MNKLLLLAFCFIAHFIQAQNKITAVSINRTRCFGKCPSYNLIITDSGYIHYDGLKDAKFEGYYIGKVSPAKVKKIFAKYKGKKLRTLPNVYKNTMADISKLHMTLVINGQPKTIRHAHMGPVYLNQLAKDMDMLVQKEKISWQQGDPDNYPDLEYKEEPPMDAEPVEVEVIPQDEVFVVVEQEPQFPGGEEALSNYIHNQRKYPAAAAELGIEGKVVCSFIVNQEGQVTDVTLLRGIGYGCDQEAIRIIKSMPLWQPGKQNGKTVRVRKNIVVNFFLE